MRIDEVPLAEAGQVNLLVSGAFGYTAPHTYFDDFPVWASKNVIRIGGYSQDVLVSHVGIQFRNLRTSKKIEKVALIGAVATHKSHQGQGYSTRLMNQAIEIAEQSGMKWCILWGSEHDFYSKFGFHLSGTQARARISELFSPGLAGEVISNLKSKIHSGFSPAILREFLSRKQGIEFKAEDEEWLSLQKTVKWFSLEDPFSFVAFERGMDLQGIVHEFGGDPAGVRELLHKVLQKNPDSQIISTTGELLRVGFSPDDLVTEGLCLARPGNPSLTWDEEFWISGLSAV
jgi:GNAT superfamily N-acetyltransferase